MEVSSIQSSRCQCLCHPSSSINAKEVHNEIILSFCNEWNVDREIVAGIFRSIFDEQRTVKKSYILLLLMQQEQQRIIQEMEGMKEKLLRSNSLPEKLQKAHLKLDKLAETLPTLEKELTDAESAFSTIREAYQKLVDINRKPKKTKNQKSQYNSNWPVVQPAFMRAKAAVQTAKEKIDTCKKEIETQSDLIKTLKIRKRQLEEAELQTDLKHLEATLERIARSQITAQNKMTLHTAKAESIIDEFIQTYIQDQAAKKEVKKTLLSFRDTCVP